MTPESPLLMGAPAATDPLDALRLYGVQQPQASPLASGGQITTADVIGAIPRPAPGAPLLEQLKDRAMRGDAGAAGLVAQDANAKASAPWYSSEGLAASKPNALGAAMSAVPSELMFLANFLGPKARIPNPIKAYHGSPHDFDRFDLSKIGTGEGAQAYGHGLYFAENENVAQTYKGAGPKQQWSALDPPKVDGKMYEVAIHATPDQFLDWDKPLSQQSEAVRKAYQQARGWSDADMEKALAGDFAGRSGMSLYNDVGLSRRGGDMQVSATEGLRDAGLSGVRYLDQGSRGSGHGAYNYSVFDPALIEILRKYGLAGSIGAGTVANALMGDKTEQ